MHKREELYLSKERMKHEKWSHSCTWKAVKMSLYGEKNSHVVPKPTGTKKLEELVFLILVAEHNFQSNNKCLKEVWALGNISRFTHSAPQFFLYLLVIMSSYLYHLSKPPFFALHLLLSLFLGLTKSIRQGHLDNSPAFWIAIVSAFQITFSTSRVA